VDPWTAYWLAPVAAVRPWLFAKLTLFILAFDLLHTHLGPAWRYGAAGFNVPHFDVLRALPVPTTSAYVGMLFFTSASALVCALVPRPPRPLLLAVAALYTWSWACSMHDSYQHHYLLSFVLLAIALFPTLDARQMFGAASTPSDAPHGLVPRVHATGLWLLTSACAVVYGYTAVAKTEPDWLSGDAMRSITQNGQTIPGALALAADLGIDADAFWWLLGHGVGTGPRPPGLQRATTQPRPDIPLPPPVAEDRKQERARVDGPVLADADEDEAVEDALGRLVAVGRRRRR
jgi:hypothetical protein